MLFVKWAPAHQEQRDQRRECCSASPGVQVDFESGPKEAQSWARQCKGKCTCRTVERPNQIPKLWMARLSAYVASTKGASTAFLGHCCSAFVPSWTGCDPSGRRSPSTDSYQQTWQTLARHFYPHTTSWVSDYGGKIIKDTTLPNLCPPARDFQVLGGSSLSCLNPNAKETIDWVTVVPVKSMA